MAEKIREILTRISQKIKSAALVVFRFGFKNAPRAILAALIIAGFFCSAIYVFATPPASKYDIGEISDPGCTYGSTNCDVVAPAGYAFSSNSFSGTGDFTTTGTITAGTFKVGSVYTFPTADGAPNQYLKTDGSGTLSWSTYSIPLTYVTSVENSLQIPTISGKDGKVLGLTGGVLTWVTNGAGSGASMALDNLSSVAINTSLLPDTTNSIDLGSTTKTFRDIYITGTANPYYIKLTGTTPTAIRTITFPNETGTVCTTGSVCSGYQASGSYLTSVTGTNLDNVWSGTGILTRTGAGTYSTTANNSANWDAAYGWGNPSGVYLPIAGTAANSSQLEGHSASYFQVAGSYQASNTNLTSIAALANSAGWLHNNGSGTFAYSTPTYSDVGALAVGGTAANSSQLEGHSASYFQVAGSYQPLDAELTGLAALSYSSGTPFVKMTSAGNFSLDTNTYITGNQTITLTGAVTGSGTTSILTALTPTGLDNVFTSNGFLKRTGTGAYTVDTNTYL